MDTEKKYTYAPDYAVAPGETLKETIETLHMDQKELALRAGLTPKTVNLMVKGKAPITADTALRLERVTGVPAHFWSNLEANYREQIARLHDQKRQKEDLAWLKKIPVKELAARGAIPTEKDDVKTLQAVLRFFGVNNAASWEQLWLAPQGSYRKSTCFQEDPGATAAWLRLGEIEAQKQQVREFNRERFQENLQKIRALTQMPTDDFVSRMTALCAEAGVVLVLVKEISGCRASGVTRWLTPAKAVIQMSLRYKSNDQFWFTFFHEAGHVLKGSKKQVFIDEGTAKTEEEKLANAFAAEALIPREYEAELKYLKSAADVNQFADKIGIAAGIVVGRLQHSGLIPFTHLNGLKQKLIWAE